MKRPVEDTLSLITGLGIGTLAAFLLDPTSGDRRRGRLGKRARGAVHSSEAAVSGLGRRAYRKAGHAASDVGDYASYAARRASKLGHRAWDAGEEWLEDVGDSLADRYESAKSKSRGAAKKVTKQAKRGTAKAASFGGLFGSLLGSTAETAVDRAVAARKAASQKAAQYRRSGLSAANRAKGKARHRYDSLREDWSEPDSHDVASHLASGLALIGLGAGLAYLLDTARNPTRRHAIAERANHFTHAAIERGKDLAERANGLAHQAADAVSGAETPADEPSA